MVKLQLFHSYGLILVCVATQLIATLWTWTHTHRKEKKNWIIVGRQLLYIIIIIVLLSVSQIMCSVFVFGTWYNATHIFRLLQQSCATWLMNCELKKFTINGNRSSLRSGPKTKNMTARKGLPEFKWFFFFFRKWQIEYFGNNAQQYATICEFRCICWT